MHILNRKPGFSDHFGSSARSKKSNLMLDQTFCKVEQASLIVDRDNSYAMLLERLFLLNEMASSQ